MSPAMVLYEILNARVETIVFYVFEVVVYENLGAFAHKMISGGIKKKKSIWKNGNTLLYLYLITLL